MGLDMYIYRVRKPQLEERTYTAEELGHMGYSSVGVNYVDAEKSLFEQILPYMVIRNVTDDYINKEKIIVDYNLPEDSYISMMGNDGVKLRGTNDSGESVSQFISMDELDKKYTITKTVPTYIWRTEEEAYWRKHYDLQEWFYNIIEDAHDTHVENCGYYVLDADLIAEMNAKFDEHVPEEDPTDDEALVYHEWY